MAIKLMLSKFFNLFTPGDRSPTKLSLRSAQALLNHHRDSVTAATKPITDFFADKEKQKSIEETLFSIEAEKTWLTDYFSDEVYKTFYQRPHVNRPNFYSSFHIDLLISITKSYTIRNLSDEQKKLVQDTMAKFNAQYHEYIRSTNGKKAIFSKNINDAENTDGSKQELNEKLKEDVLSTSKEGNDLLEGITNHINDLLIKLSGLKKEFVDDVNETVESLHMFLTGCDERNVEKILIAIRAMPTNIAAQKILIDEFQIRYGSNLDFKAFIKVDLRTLDKDDEVAIHIIKCAEAVGFDLCEFLCDPKICSTEANQRFPVDITLTPC